MSLRTQCLILAAVIYCTNELKAQRVIPIGALPAYYNGGFAGEAGAPRVASFSYVKYQFSQGNPAESSLAGESRWVGRGTFISADHFVKKIRSGVAFTAGLENFSDLSKGVSVSGAISPKFSFKGKYTFAPFADFSYARFHNQLRYPVYPYDFPSKFVTHDFKIRSGFLINSARAYIGLSVVVADYATNVLEGKEKWRSFPNSTYVFQTGYTFQRTPDSKFSFTPQLALSFFRYKSPDPTRPEPVTVQVINLTDLNLMFRYDKFITGINSSGFVLGYQTDKFKLLVSNFYSRKQREGKTVNLSDHTHFNTKPYSDVANTYTGNISLKYIFRKKESVKMSGF